MAEVKLENVTKLYGNKVAVREVSFSCREGEFLSIAGPTGAGSLGSTGRLVGDGAPAAG